MFSHDVITVLFPHGVLIILKFLIKFCEPELKPDDRCKPSEMSLINWICRLKNCI